MLYQLETFVFQTVVMCEELERRGQEDMLSIPRRAMQHE
jgi:hypothetical protein